MRSYRRYIHCSNGVREDENVIEIVFTYQLGFALNQVVASRLLKYRNNLDVDKQLTPSQFEEYGKFIDYIDELITKYNFEVENPDDNHQSDKSYSYYFKFTAIDKYGTYMDEHRIVLRISDHPQKNQSLETLEAQARASWGLHQKSLCENIVIYPGNGTPSKFSSVDDAKHYVSTLFKSLYEGKYYGMVRFPRGDARIPRPFNQYFDIVIPSEYNRNLKYTYENALNFVDANILMPLAWARPSEDSPKTIIDIGDILIVKEVDTSRLLVIAFDSDEPYLLTSKKISDIVQ